MKTTLLFLFLTLGFFLNPVQAVGNSKKTNSDKLISISYQNADIAEVYETLSKHKKVNILLAAGVSGQISINLYDMTLDDTIHIIAMTAGLAVQKTKGSYIISKQGEVGKDVLGGLTEVRAFKVQYSDTTQVKTILDNHLSRYGKITTLDERNVLVVEDKPEFISKIKRILEEIDKEPTQILIEAKILDIKLNDDDQYGIDWTKTIGDKTFGLTGLSTPTSGFFFTLFNKNIDLKLNALARKGRTRTLSSPKLLALENRKASVIIGKQLGYSTTTTINQISTETVEFIDSGIILTVTPSIDNIGRILLDIHPEISDGVLDGQGIPQLTTTSVTTQLIAEDGQTVFIAGLIKNTMAETSDGIPFLSDIPFIGRAFSNNLDNRENTETVVIITPHIVRTAEQRLGYSTREDFMNMEKEAELVSTTIDKKFAEDFDIKPDVEKQPGQGANKSLPNATNLAELCSMKNARGVAVKTAC